MLIATYFKRPSAPITLPNADGSSTVYYFRPVDPNVPESEHVASVTDKDHIARLLAIREGYYIAESEKVLEAASQASATVAAKPVAAPAAQPPVPPADESPAPTAPSTSTEQIPAPTADTAPEPPASETETAANAQALLDLPLKAFKQALADKPKPVLSQALEIELAKGENERATYTKALRAALG